MVWLSSSYLWCLKAVLTPFWVFFFLPQCSCKGDAPYQEPENMHKKSFHTSKSATSDHVRGYLEETLHPVEWQKLNWSTSCWNSFTKLPHFFSLHSSPENSMRYGVSLRKKGGKSRALWGYYESRLWSESGNCLCGNVKVSQISSTSKKGLVCWREGSS